MDPVDLLEYNEMIVNNRKSRKEDYSDVHFPADPIFTRPKTSLPKKKRSHSWVARLSKLPDQPKHRRSDTNGEEIFSKSNKILSNFLLVLENV